MKRNLTLWAVGLVLLISLGFSVAAGASPSPQGLEAARRLVQLKPLDYKTIARIMEIDCLAGLAGSRTSERLNLEETKTYCRVVGEVFWAQVKDQVYEAMAQAYAHYLTPRELEVLVEGLAAERRGRASRFPPQETRDVVSQLRRVDPGIKAEISWQIKQIVRRWKEKFSLDAYFKKQFQELVLEKLPWKIRSKIIY